MRKLKARKGSIDYQEYQGGYAKVREAELRAVLEGYRLGVLAKTELRVFAALYELKSLRKGSRVTLYRVVNAKSRTRGVKQLTQREIARATNTLDVLLPKLTSGIEDDAKRVATKPVARRVLRQIAFGLCSSVDALFLLYYSARRLRPPRGRALMRLHENERYARFTHGGLSKLIGVHKDTLSRTLTRLQQRGLINTAPVAKRNENYHGLLFIDGPMISLTRVRQTSYRRLHERKVRDNKTSATRPRLISTPRHKRSEPRRNNNPKTKIKISDLKVGQGCPDGRLSRSADPEVQRILERVQQIKMNSVEQAA